MVIRVVVGHARLASVVARIAGLARCSGCHDVVVDDDDDDDVVVMVMLWCCCDGVDQDGRLLR